MNFSVRRNFGKLRRHDRFVTAFEAEMILGAEQHSVVVGDISACGALVRTTRPPLVGSEIWLRAAGLNLPAQVRWVRDGLCGVQFGEQVDPHAIVRDNSPDYQA